MTTEIQDFGPAWVIVWPDQRVVLYELGGYVQLTRGPSISRAQMWGIKSKAVDYAKDASLGRFGPYEIAPVGILIEEAPKDAPQTPTD